MLVKKVGIPRGLFYYKYFPLWKTFLEELGAEIVVSDYTSKKILDVGVKTCVDEICLPMKIYHGHIASLKDKVDYLFIPRFTSISRNEYVCPKFGGLPDMVRHSFKNLPVIIDTEVNLRKSNKNGIVIFSYIFLYSFGRFFIEGLRTDSLMIGPLRIAQCVSLAAMLISLTYISYNYRKKHH